MEVHGFGLHIESPPVVVVHLKYNAWWTNPFWSTEKTRNNSSVQLWSKSFEPIFHWIITYLIFTCASHKCFTAQAGIILSPYRLLWLFIEVASKKKNILPAKRAQERLLGEAGERRETTDLLTSISRDWDCERIVIRLAWSGATLNVHTLGIFLLFPRRSRRRDSPMPWLSLLWESEWPNGFATWSAF